MMSREVEDVGLIIWWLFLLFDVNDDVNDDVDVDADVGADVDVDFDIDFGADIDVEEVLVVSVAL